MDLWNDVSMSNYATKAMWNNKYHTHFTTRKKMKNYKQTSKKAFSNERDVSSDIIEYKIKMESAARNFSFKPKSLRSFFSNQGDYVASS